MAAMNLPTHLPGPASTLGPLSPAPRRIRTQALLPEHSWDPHPTTEVWSFPAPVQHPQPH